MWQCIARIAPKHPEKAGVSTPRPTPPDPSQVSGRVGRLSRGCRTLVAKPFPRVRRYANDGYGVATERNVVYCENSK